MIAQPKSGRQVAAFFDLDGTLTKLPSLESRFLRELRRKRLAGPANAWSWLAETLRLAKRGLAAMQHGNKMYLRGLSVDESIAAAGVNAPFFEAAVDRASWHARRGHEIVIVSGTLEPLARAASQALERLLAQRGTNARIGVIATRLERELGNLTGRILGEAMYGETKARAIEWMASERGFDLRQCYAYGDSMMDRWMLRAVGLPFVVNPSGGLSRLARTNGWKVFDWASRRQEGIAQRVSRPDRPGAQNQTAPASQPFRRATKGLEQ